MSFDTEFMSSFLTLYPYQAAVGPLEATIKSLKNNIETVKKENGELQRRWMASQMELVGLQNEALVANERVDRMRSQVLIEVF